MSAEQLARYEVLCHGWKLCVNWGHEVHQFVVYLISDFPALQIEVAQLNGDITFSKVYRQSSRPSQGFTEERTSTGSL